MKIFFTGVISLYGLIPINSYCQDSDTLFVLSEPHFPGGLDSLMKFMKATIRLPHKVDWGGEITVQLSIDSTGSISNNKINIASCEACTNSITDVIKKMPRWIPAKLNGKPINGKTMFRIRFEY